MTQLEQTQSVVLDPPAATGTNALLPTVLRVAWLSIGLGLALEVVLLVLAAFTDTAGDTPKPFISDLAQKVSWSFIVCVGLAFGTTAGKARAGVMGLLGLISAPAGFTAARAVHKAVNGALGVAGKTMAPGLVMIVGGLKGLQYALFGAALAWIAKRAFGLKAYLAAGLAFGLTFGLGIVAATVRASARSPRSTSPPARSTRCSSPWAAPWCCTPRERWPSACRDKKCPRPGGDKPLPYINSILSLT